MPAHIPKQEPARHSPYPKRERTKSSKSALAELQSQPAPSKTKRASQDKGEAPSESLLVLRSSLFDGINPLYLVRSVRAIARGNYSYAHGFLHLCIVQARHAAARQGGASAIVVCLLMLYSDNWLRLGIPSRAIISMEDALIAQEQMGEETEEDIKKAALAGAELQEYMQLEKAH